MKTRTLNGAWTLEIPGTPFAAVPATVPGSVYHDLLAAERIPDPFYRDNEMEALKLMDNDFVYFRSFQVDDALLAGDKVLLRAEGLDTIAAVHINGQIVGEACNMHRIWEFDVKSVLRPGENTITVSFRSPTKYIKEAYAKSVADGSSDAMVGFPNIRKAHCMFGWDWGPRLPDAGIWRNISIISIEKARIQDVRVDQFHKDGTVRLRIHTNLNRYTDDEVWVNVSVTAPDGSVLTASGTDCELIVQNPQLWWPAGFGGQPLYQLSVSLCAKGKELDVWSRRIGLRTMTVSRRKDQWGESFSHCVNGVDIFAMGADYIPEDNLLPRVNPERTRRLLEDAKAANMNCIRVWGGGYYPDDFFYDICDELGLLVWQDFMFACAVYNLTDAFEENITAEFVDNVRRLRHHASLALWCGNNEMEQFVAQGEWVTSMRQKADYIKMYEYIIPKVLKAEDPQAFYWPASPSSGGSFDDPQDPTRGDVHYWMVWHGLLPFTDYRNHQFRYVSEFGFQSFPCTETIESFTEPEDRNVFSYVMEKHQRNNAANSKIMTYLGQTYRYPTTGLGTLLYTSQLLSAEAMKYGVEHWRRHRGQCMGAIVWQLNDCWPVASWSSIDYFGRWKALHYYEKRFFAPVLLSCEEKGFLDDPNPNRECRDLNTDTVKSIRLNVSNETMQPQTVTVKWELRNNRSEVLRDGGEVEITVPAMDTVWLDTVELPEANMFTDHVHYACYQNGEMISESTVLFSVPKYYDYIDPQLSCRVEGDEIIVSAKAYAKSVEVLNENEDWVLEDNYFDLEAGEERRIRIVSGDANGIHMRSVYNIR